MMPRDVAPRAIRASASRISPAARPVATPLWLAAGPVRSWKICPYGLIFQDLTGPAASQSGVATGRAAGLIRDAEARIARGATSLGIITAGFRPYLESLGV